MQTPQTSVPDPADLVIAREQARRQRSRLWLIAGGVVALIVGYPLSFIPLLILMAYGIKYGILPDAIRDAVFFVYSPVTYAVNNVPLVNDLFEFCFQCLGITL